MEELVKLVVKNTGISEAQARGAVTTVLGYLKQHLPEPIASQIEPLLNNPAMLGQAEDMLKGLGGMLGGLGKDK